MDKLLSLQESLRQTWSIWTHHFGKFVGVTTVLMAGMYLFIMSGIGVLFQGGQSLNQGVSIWNSSVLYFFLLTAFGTIALQAFGTVLLSYLSLKKGEENVHTAVTRALGSFFDFIVLIFVEIVLSFFTTALGYVVVIILGSLLGKIFGVEVLEKYFTLLSVIPGLFNMVLANYVVFSLFILLENGGYAVQAVKTSAKMVHQHFFPVLWRLIASFAILILFVLLVQYIPVIGFALGGILALSLFNIYSAVLYQNLKTITKVSYGKRGS